MAEHPEKVLHPARWPRAEIPFFSFLELSWVAYAGPVLEVSGSVPQSRPVLRVDD